MLPVRIDDHLELRLAMPADAPALFALVDANRPHLRKWLPWVDGTASAADNAAFIETAMKQHEAGRGFHAAIVVDGAVSGMIGHHEISWANLSTSLGYWLAASHEGRGVVTRACAALVAHAFGELGLHRIEIRCATGNTRSRAIPERLGFRLEGTLRAVEWLNDRFVDHAVYGLLREEWKSDDEPTSVLAENFMERYRRAFHESAS